MVESERFKALGFKGLRFKGLGLTACKFELQVAHWVLLMDWEPFQMRAMKNFSSRRAWALNPKPM